MLGIAAGDAVKDSIAFVHSTCDTDTTYAPWSCRDAGLAAQAVPGGASVWAGAARSEGEEAVDDDASLTVSVRPRAEAESSTSQTTSAASVIPKPSSSVACDEAAKLRVCDRSMAQTRRKDREAEPPSAARRAVVTAEILTIPGKSPQTSHVIERGKKSRRKEPAIILRLSIAGFLKIHDSHGAAGVHAYIRVYHRGYVLGRSRLKARSISGASDTRNP